MKLTLPKWYDLHAHFRQDELVAPLIRDHLDMGCAGILAMPNTDPPVAKVLKSNLGNYASIEHYLGILRNAGGEQFDDIIVPLYLTADTRARTITSGAKTGFLRACKYYPPHGTTGAQFGAALETHVKSGVFAAMEEAGIILCIHGEAHDLTPEKYFDRSQNAEEIFYESMNEFVKSFPKLKIVCEHITTKTAVDFVKKAPETVVATVTPQHLIYTVGSLLQGLKYHLYCLPLPKFEKDRAALRKAVTARDNTKFFAGTDSAPHTDKLTECGCAAGCYTGGIAPQLYAEAFEMAGASLENKEGEEAFRRFLCTNGPDFYGLSLSQETFILEKKPQTVSVLKIGDREIIPLPLGMQGKKIPEIEIPWSIADKG